MIFKEVATVTAPLKDCQVININDTCHFTAEHVSSSSNCYNYCIKDVEGDFEIRKISNQAGQHISYKKGDTIFSIAQNAFGQLFNFHVYVSAEFEETTYICVTHELNIPSIRLKFLKPRQFFKDVIQLNEYGNITFTYYVKKIQEGTIELHIANPNEAVIQGLKTDYKYETSDNRDLKLALSIAFDPNNENFHSYSYQNNAFIYDKKTVKATKISKNYNLYDIMSDKTYSDVVLLSSSGKEI
uniref:Uncharacterized protein n=1 Tax=Panagrolaimus sp. ES5 TaxID=591445 RepID=A0AC34GCT8_9BILA